MKHQNILVAILLTVIMMLALVVAGRSLYSRTGKEAVAIAPGTTARGAMDIKRDVLIPARDAEKAPALSEGTWVNSEPLKLENLRGRVVLVDFWTFGCYNCRNTLPALKRWDTRYRERGLTIIGVHSPESEHEKQTANVRREVRSLGISYPVVTDNNYETWRAYGIRAWPTTVILDKQGRIRWMHIGEGYYDEMDGVIQKLLAEKE